MTPELFSLHKTFRARGKKPELRHILEAVLSAAARFSSCFVICDALDECVPEHRGDLLNVISSLQTQLKVFTMSRPRPQDIVCFFQNVPSITVYADTDDIKNFLSAQVNKRLFFHHDLKDR